MLLKEGNKVDLMYVIKERHGRGNKEMCRVPLPTVPRIGELFKVVETGRWMRVRSITTNLWESGKTLAVETTVRGNRPYGEIVLGTLTDDEKKELREGSGIKETEDELETTEELSEIEEE